MKLEMNTTSTDSNYEANGCRIDFFNGGRNLQGSNEHHVQRSDVKIEPRALTAHELDQMIAKEMTGLSMQERTRAEEDLQ